MSGGYVLCQDSISFLYWSGCQCEALVSHSEMAIYHAKISHHTFLYPLKLCIPYFLLVLTYFSDTFWLISPTWTVASYLVTKVSFVWIWCHVVSQKNINLSCTAAKTEKLAYSQSLCSVSRYFNFWPWNTYWLLLLYSS